MSALDGTRQLVWLILRRDRLPFLFWIAVVSLAPIGIAASAIALYTTPEAIAAFAKESTSSSAAVAMLGPVFSPTLGGLVAWRSGLQTAILIGPASILFAIRYTRSEEEQGRRELVGAAAVGRQAPLAAALTALFGVSLVIGAIIAAGLIALGLPAAGAIALGLSATSAGCLFAALGGLAAQLTQTPGAARSIGLLTFALLYVISMLASLTGREGFLWLSPVGWLRQTRAFAGEQWLAFALLAGMIALLAAAAYALSARRDLGAGLLPPRQGPATAAPGLRGPLSLAWRLQKGAMLSWAAGFGALGVLLGAVSPTISGFVDVPQLRDWAARSGAANPGDAFLFTIVYILGQVAAAYAVTAAFRLRSEEVDGRADPILAAPVGRLRWAVGHLLFAVAGPTVALLALGLPVGLLYGLGVGNPGGELLRLLTRALSVLPAVWVVVGLAVALYGLLPRLAWFATWALLAVFGGLELAWELQQVSPALFAISPFAHVHWSVPITLTTLLGLMGVAIALGAAGLAGLRHRDIG